MERRAVLKGFVGILGSAALAPFALPGRLLGWAAITGVAPTHQWILSRALQLVSQDPSVRHLSFPAPETLTNHDYVTVTGITKWGPGPDMDGNSPYSWHYYNPLRETGEAPLRSAEFFRSMMSERASGQDSSRSTAWGVHFLADMFVPYHTVGTPAIEAHDAFVFGTGDFPEADSGPVHLLYSLSEPPPPGWGQNGNFSQAVALFCRTFPLGSEGDWFDPWYLNGYGGGWMPLSAGVATGSHGSWELSAWTGPTFELLEGSLQAMLQESPYDPLWDNQRASFEGDAWGPQARGVEAFAKACAGRTRQANNFELVLRSPAVGIAATVKGVATWLRASLTALSLRVTQEPLFNGGYRLIAHIQNAHPDEHVLDIEVRMVYNLAGRWFGGVTRYEGVIGPAQSGTMVWDFPQGEPINGVLEVIGNYPFTPDLGYARLTFDTQPGQQEVDPEVLANWQGVWTLSGTDRLGPTAGTTTDFGTLEVWVEGTTAQVKSSQGPNILPMRVVDNGTCVEFDWRNDVLWATGRLCMGPDRASYTGVLRGAYLNRDAPVQGDLFGRRVREEAP